MIFLLLIYLLIFLILCFFVFYTVGFIILSRNRNLLENQEIISLSFSLGAIAFVILALFFGIVNLRFLVLPILFIISVFTIFKFKFDLLTPWKIFSDKILLLIIIVGIISLGLINFPSGYLYQDGLLFWSSQGHDGLWHVASMEQIKKAIPPQNPGYSGELIYNYHYLVDILMGEFSRIFPFFSSLDLYFRFFPILLAFMLGISTFSLLSRWQKSKKIAYLGIFFTFFVGSFGYVVTFLKDGNLLGGETVFWAAQQHTIIGNPPHAISHSLIASFFLSFLIFTKYRNIFWFLISFFLVAILSGFKVSGGLVLLIGLGFASLIDLLFYRRFSILLLTFALGISNFITFKLLTSKGAESNLMFLPWWFIRTMVVDKLDWIDLEHRRQHYLSKGTWHANLRVIQLELIAFVIFLVGNLGMRIMGFYEIIKKLLNRKFYSDPFEVMVFTTMLTGFLIPIFFVQRGIVYNNIQFMQYFLYIFGFYGAISTYKILGFIKNKAGRIIIFLIIALLSLPTVLGIFSEFYGPGRSPLAKISRVELEALEILKDQSEPSAVILTKPFDKYLNAKFKSHPWPIYAWYDTNYVAAISQRVTYLTSEHVTLLNYPGTKEREENKEKFFKQEDLNWNKRFLNEEGIDYIYVAKEELKNSIDLEKNGLQIFFENQEVIIFKVI